MMTELEASLSFERRRTRNGTRDGMTDVACAAAGGVCLLRCRMRYGTREGLPAKWGELAGKRGGEGLPAKRGGGGRAGSGGWDWRSDGGGAQQRFSEFEDDSDGGFDDQNDVQGEDYDDEDRVDAKGSADGRTVGGKPRSRFGNRKSANLTRVTIPPRDFHEESVKIDGLATKCISWAFQV